MQLMMILGIVFSIGAVSFALQNNVPVAVTLAAWQFEGSLALVLIMALGLGMLIMGLLSSPAVIRGQWTSARLRHQLVKLEKDVAEQKKHNHELDIKLARRAPVSEPQI
jgi:putative membrane protein